MKEPNLENEHRLRKLWETFKTHGSLIVGVDFDDTVFPAKDHCWTTLCDGVKQALLEAYPNIKICLYTVADDQSLRYKVALMKEWGLEPKYINESPIKIGNGQKPYFNLLLDDKAGLYESLQLLRRFNSLTKKYTI